jgi:hypothetical protein
MVSIFISVTYGYSFILVCSILNFLAISHLTTSHKGFKVPVFNRPISDKFTSIKTEFMLRVVRLVNIFNSLAYDWMIKDERKAS